MTRAQQVKKLLTSSHLVVNYKYVFSVNLFISLTIALQVNDVAANVTLLRYLLES